jgi:acyl-lipid omega-6 desaturase (Delta-12 desaturase)
MIDPSQGSEADVRRRLKPFARERVMQSWVHLLVVMMCIMAAYLVLFSVSNLFISLLSACFLSLVILRFFVIYHDYAHKTILRNSGVATLIFTLFGLYVLAPLSIWRRSHNHHHQHNSKFSFSGIGSFPIITKRAYLVASRSQRFRYLFMRHPATLVCGYFVGFLFGMCIGNLNKLRKHPDALGALVLHFGVGGLIFWYGGSVVFLCAFIIPAFISSAIGSYLFYVQHNYPGVVHRANTHWSNYHAALKSSGYIRMNALMNWFTGNIGYHHIHHLNSAVPFYNLPKAYCAIPELRIEADTTLHPRDIITCLGLKVWDEALDRMSALDDV